MMGLVAAATWAGACTGRAHPAATLAPPPLPDPATTAERSGYTRTPNSDDVRRFLNVLGRQSHSIDSLGLRDSSRAASANFDLFAIDTSAEGRPIPIAVAARPMVSSGAAAHRGGGHRPIVLVVAGADASDVDGTSATLATLRNVLADANAGPSLIDSIVLVTIPLANPDGAQHRRPTRMVRDDLDGPDSVGDRLNAQGIDLTRDILAARAPESRQILSVLRAWDPDVVIELRTSAGGSLGYDLTVAPPRNPAALLTGSYARDSLFPALVESLAAHDLPTTETGHLFPDLRPESDARPYIWDATDDQLTGLTEYVAVRNRLSLRIDAYARAPFARRVAATTVALEEALAIVASRASSIRSLTTASDTTVEHWGANPDEAPTIPIAGRVDSIGHGGTILVADLTAPGDSAAPPRDARHTVPPAAPVHPLYVSILDREIPTATTRLPFSYVLPAKDSGLVKLLLQHNIRVTRLASDRDAEIVERFLPDAGHWLREITPTKPATLPAGSYVVSTAQPLGVLAALLLEPLSADGLAALGVIKPVSAGAQYPVSRLIY
jgi:hypothetical protein